MPAARRPSGSSVSSTSAMAMPKSTYSRSSRWRTFSRLVEADFQLDALRQLGGEALGGRDDALAHVEDVVAVLLVGGDEHGALAVEAADVAVGRVFQLTSAMSRTRTMRPSDRGDDGVAHLVERGVAAGGLEAEAARPEVDEAAGNVGVLALQRR